MSATFVNRLSQMRIRMLKKKKMLGAVGSRGSVPWKISLIFVYEFEGKCLMLVEEQISYLGNISLCGLLGCRLS